MAYTGYFDHSTGATLYGKARPLNTSTWATGVVTMTETGTTGSYSSASFVDATSYSVYLRAGASPASTDTKMGTIEPNAGAGDATLANQTAILAAVTGAAQPYAYSDTITHSVSGDPLDGVSVWLVNEGLTEAIDATQTNALGEFTVRTDAAGDYELLIQETGFSSRRVPITIS